jgi:hypothetical protein
MKKYGFLTLFLAALNVFAELPLDEFMKFARNPNAISTYAALEGTVQHQRRGSALQNETIYFAMLITPDRLTGQVIISDKEGYAIGQSRKVGNYTTTVLPMPNSDKANRLGHMGLRADDLAMGFLFYPVVKELGRENVSVVPCRVILLEAPDKSEQVKVYIAAKHYFPLKAEFFAKGKPLDGMPDRTLETSSFEKKNNLYYTKTIKVSGPGWRTRVEFDSAKANINELESTNPPAIMRKLEK